MTPAEVQAMCSHTPYFQKGCLGCEVRHMKMLRSPDRKLSRAKQNEFLAGLPEHRAKQVIDILKAEAA